MIYKYCDINIVEKILDSDSIKFTPPNKFNDPYDVCVFVKPYSYRDFAKLYNTQRKKKDLYIRYRNSGLYNTMDDFNKIFIDPEFGKLILNNDKEYVNKWITNYPNKISENILISCFSKSPESILMWSHYAEKHKGCVLGFDYDEDEKFNESLYEVKYKSVPKSINIKFCYGYKNINELKKTLNTKYKAWSYEKEIRLIYPKDKLDVLNKEKTIYGLKNCHTHLKQIILGNKFSNNSLKNKITKISKQKGISLKKGELLLQEYKMSVVDIKDVR